MKVHIEWLDGQHRTYDDVVRLVPGRDQVLRLYGHPVGGRETILAELPTFSIREWKREGR